VNAGPDSLQIVTVIDEDSSNCFDSPALLIPITPWFADGTLSFRPAVTYWAQHYLAAVGAGGSHSNGFIHAAVFSSDSSEGGAMAPEASAIGQMIWDRRASGPYSEDGHQLNELTPDEEGSAVPALLQVDVTDVDVKRFYFGQVRIESSVDADGGHLLYASQASVFFIARVLSAVVEQRP
jgi:hypothetical protein